MSPGTLSKPADIAASDKFSHRRPGDQELVEGDMFPYWLPFLEQAGALGNCHPDQFKTVGSWPKLYTIKGLQAHAPEALKACPNEEDYPCLVVIVPGDSKGLGGPYALTGFHKLDALKRVTVSWESQVGSTKKKRSKQVSFCPYCGIRNENQESAYLHVRRHLVMSFLCGACLAKAYTKSESLAVHFHTDCWPRQPEVQKSDVQPKRKHKKHKK